MNPLAAGANGGASRPLARNATFLQRSEQYMEPRFLEMKNVPQTWQTVSNCLNLLASSRHFGEQYSLFEFRGLNVAPHILQSRSGNTRIAASEQAFEQNRDVWARD